MTTEPKKDPKVDPSKKNDDKVATEGNEGGKEGKEEKVEKKPLSVEDGESSSPVFPFCCDSALSVICLGRDRDSWDPCTEVCCDALLLC